MIAESGAEGCEHPYGINNPGRYLDGRLQQWLSMMGTCPPAVWPDKNGDLHSRHIKDFARSDMNDPKTIIDKSKLPDGGQHASLEWRDNGVPVSTEYDDIYFCTDSGMQETFHTFLQHNQLPERFSALMAGECFTIGETGFGTGLSFICAWQLFDERADCQARLHFISTEKHLMQSQDWHRTLDLWPELARYSEQLKRIYLPACPGQQHFVFDNGRVRLTLLIGDVKNTLPDFCGTIDAWFLDGFNPAKNPDMWQPGLFRSMAVKSHKSTTYATFTAARAVRDGLAEAGFSVEKTSGFGKKRDMTKGQLMASKADKVFTPGWQSPPAPGAREARAIVIGGGLAGTSTARALAQRGWQVTLLEQHNALASEASGNPQGILYTKLSAHQTPLSRLILQGYLFSINLLKSMEGEYDGLWQQTGVIQLATSDNDRLRHQSLARQYNSELLSWHQAEQLSEYSGIPVAHDGLFYPQAGWVSPRLFCQALACHTHIEVVTHQAVHSLKKEKSKWVLLDKHQREIDCCDTVVMAGGIHSTQLPQLLAYPIKAIRGQVTEVQETIASSRLSACICDEGYIAPASLGRHTLGATFDFNDNCQKVRAADHQRNLAQRDQWLPEVMAALGGKQVEITGGRTGFRCTSPDYLPLVGAVVDKNAFMSDFAGLSQNARREIPAAPRYLGGLYINTGHGSRGLVTCPLAGEVLAAMITGDSLCIPESLRQQLNPSRFLARQLIKHKK